MCEESLSVGWANLLFLTVKCRKRINASPSINKSTERHTRVPHYQSAIFYTIATTLQPALLPEQLNIMIQRTANENAACLHRICKRSDQPKIERLVNNDARPCIIVYCYIARLSLHKMSTVSGWFLVTRSWSNSNVSRPGYNCAAVARKPSLFVCFCYMKV